MPESNYNDQAEDIVDTFLSSEPQWTVSWLITQLQEEMVYAIEQALLSAHRSALEQAAKIAEEAFSDQGWTLHYANAAVTIAAAIRKALPQPPTAAGQETKHAAAN